MVFGQAAQAASQQTTSFGKAAAFIKTAGLTALGATGGFLALHAVMQSVRKAINAVVDGFVEFDQQMTESLAIQDVSVQMQGRMEQAVRNVAKTTTFSAGEAGAGLYYLASAGLDAEQQIGALPVVAQFAQAGMFDMSKATELAMDSLHALGLNSNDAATNTANLKTVLDQVTVAAIESNATIEEFGDALTNRAAASARILGKDAAETLAVLSAFAAVGVKGKTAGQQLYMVWRDLGRTAIKNQDAFRQFNVSVYDVNGEFRDTADVIGDLNAALDGMSDAQKRAALTQMGFQDRSLGALMTILDQSDAIRSYEYDLRHAAGATEEVAKKQLQSLRNQMVLLKNNIIDVAISGGQQLLKFASFLADTFGPTVSNLHTIFGNLASALSPLARAFATVVGVPIVATFKAMAAVLQPLTDFLSKHSEVVTVLAGLYIGRLVPALAESASGWLMLSRYMKAVAIEGMAAKWNALTTSIAEGALQGGFFTGILARMAPLFISLGGVAKRALDAILMGLFQINSQQGLVGMQMIVGKLGAAFGRLGTFIGNVAGPAIVAGVLIKQSWDKTRQSAESFAKDASQGFDLTNLEGINAAISNIESLGIESQKASDKNNNLWGSIKGGLELMSPFNRNTVQMSHERVIALAKERDRLVELRDNYIKNMGQIAASTGATEEDVAAAAAKMGVDLTEAFDNKKGEIARGKVAAEINRVKNATAQVGLSSKLAEADSAEAWAAIGDEAEEAGKKVEDAIAAWHDPLMAYNTALEKTKVLFGSFTDPGQVWSDLVKDTQDAVDKLAKTDSSGTPFDDQIDAQEKKIEDLKEKEEELQNLAEESKFQLRSGGTRDTEQTKEYKQQIKNVKALRDEEEDRLRELKKQSSDAAKQQKDDTQTKVLPTWSAYVAKLKEASDKTKTYQSDLQVLYRAGASQELLEALKGMGTEGVTMIHNLAAAASDEAKGMPIVKKQVEEANAAIRTLTDPKTANLGLWADELDNQAENFAGWEKDLLTIASRSGKKLGAQSGQNIATYLAGLGPEYAAVVHELANANQGEFDRITGNINTLSMTMVDRVTKDLQAVSYISAASANTIGTVMVTTLMEKFGVLPGAIKDLFAAAGLQLPTIEGIDVLTWSKLSPAQRNQIRNSANGNIFKSFAVGGVESHQPQVAGAGTWRVWAEPETGGEAYIPLSMAKRARSTALLREVADMFGYQLIRMQSGGILGNRQPVVESGGGKITVIQVPVPERVVADQKFYLEGVDPRDAAAYAERQARKQALVRPGTRE
jgi:TP901 family phage tail tape measure protein